jgi:peptide deformylase
VTTVYFERNFRLQIYGPEINHVLSKPVEENEWSYLPKLFEYMKEVMRRAGAHGLSAPQIALFRQFIVIERYDGSVTGLINPEVVRLYGREIDRSESCLSLPPPGNGCLVPRLETVDVEAALVEKPELRTKLTFRGSIARIVQRQLDYLTGTFFIDRVAERRRSEVLDRFYSWKSMRRAQIRRTEENRNVDTGAFAISRGQSGLS